MLRSSASSDRGELVVTEGIPKRESTERRGSPPQSMAKYTRISRNKHEDAGHGGAVATATTRKGTGKQVQEKTEDAEEATIQKRASKMLSQSTTAVL